MSEETKLKHTESVCVYCGHVLDASCETNGGDARPEEGALSLCINCAGVMVFNADLSLRQPTDDETVEITENEELMEVLGKARQAIVRINTMS